MRSLAVVGTGGGVDGGGGGGGGGRSFNTQDQSRGERPRSTTFASLYLVPPPHSYTLWKTRRFFTRLSKEGKKKKIETRIRRASGRVRRSRRTHRCGAEVFRVGRREACCESLPSIRPVPHLPCSLSP